MKDDQTMKQAAIEGLKRALLESLGENDSSPTQEEITAHKRRAKLRLKYPNLTFANQHQVTNKGESNAN